MKHALALALLVAGLGFPGQAASKERTLIVVLDAVPFATMARLTGPQADGSEPLFAAFAPPLPLISTFPSSTSVALAGILGDLGLARSPGYEARFFDWGVRRRRGGGPLSYFQVTFPWRRFFDWNRTGPARNALHAALPIRAGKREIARALAAYRASDEPLFTIYIADTDTAAHLFGPDGFDAILRLLDSELEGLADDRVVLLSDHGLAGGEPLVNVLPAVRGAVENHGWRWAESLQRPGDVVLTPYGLVSSFEAYTDPAVTLEVAAALAEVPGVGLCVLETGVGWQVLTAGGRLDFERRAGTRDSEWKWRSAGVPGELAAVLEAAGRPDTWLADAAVLAATAGSALPDPLYRLAGAFEAVDNPASVLCSVAPGHMFGARGAERSARWTKGRLRWTHGALGRDASLGFLMTNRLAAEGPPAVRFDRALELALGPTTPGEGRE